MGKEKMGKEEKEKEKKKKEKEKEKLLKRILFMKKVGMLRKRKRLANSSVVFHEAALKRI